MKAGVMNKAEAGRWQMAEAGWLPAAARRAASFYVRV
jgi:hypothetical protein